MPDQSGKETLILFVGDILSFMLALWLALFLRYFSWPGWELYLKHLIPFYFIFGIWLLVYFIFDLYGKQTLAFKRRLPSVVLNAQIVNSLIALIFFYFIPYFGITPKTILFIDLVLTFILVTLWRRYLAGRLYRGRRENILFLCRGPEVDELIHELKNNRRYHASVSLGENGEDILAKQASVVVFNPYDRSLDDSLSDYYQMMFGGIRFVNIHTFYEEVFDRVPLGLINERWFLENISNSPKPIYDFLKRALDILSSLAVGVLSLVVYPLVWLAIKIDDGGPLFFSQERVGRKGKVFKIYKFRSMKDDRITRVGRWLRRTRLDELPQLWSVFKGDQSLVGPRPEKPDYVEIYRRDIPYYEIRHLIAPGLSGWAQMYHENHPHFNIGLAETREKLSYDLYYVKNRSWWLDLKIVLKTINILIRRTGK